MKIVISCLFQSYFWGAILFIDRTEVERQDMCRIKPTTTTFQNLYVCKNSLIRNVFFSPLKSKNFNDFEFDVGTTVQ